VFTDLVYRHANYQKMDNYASKTNLHPSPTHHHAQQRSYSTLHTGSTFVARAPQYLKGFWNILKEPHASTYKKKKLKHVIFETFKIIYDTYCIWYVK
jgi:hypothetical protein